MKENYKIRFYLNSSFYPDRILDEWTIRKKGGTKYDR